MGNPDTINNLIGNSTPSFRGLDPIKVDHTLESDPIKAEAIESIKGKEEDLQDNMSQNTKVNSFNQKEDFKRKKDIHVNDTDYYNSISARGEDAYSFIEGMIEES